MNKAFFRTFILCIFLFAVFSGLFPAAQAGQPTPKTITMLMPGDSSEDACRRVSEALSTITLPRYGFAVKLDQLPKSDYDETLWLRLQGSMQPDVFYFEPGYSLSTYVYNNLLAPLSQLTKSYPELAACFESVQWSAKTKFRTVYTIPLGTGDICAGGFLARKDILDEMGISADNITNLEQLHEVLLRVKAEYPDMTPVVTDCGSIPGIFLCDMLGNSLGALTPRSENRVVNPFETYDYASFCRSMYQWNQEGLIPGGISLRGESASDQMAAMNGFGFFCKLNTDHVLRYSRACAVELTPIILTMPAQDSDGIGAGWSLPSSGSDKTAAMQLLNLLYTDAEAAGILVNGTKEDPENDPWIYSLPGFPSLPQKLLFDWELGDSVLWQSPAYGLTFHSALEDTAVSGCDTVIGHYDRALRAGDLDPSKALPRFLLELRDAGIDDLVAEKQLQLDAYLAQR